MAKKTLPTSPHGRLPDAVMRVLEARHHDPFEVLGCHPQGKNTVIRAFLPGAKSAWIACDATPLTLTRHEASDLFLWSGPRPANLPSHPMIHWCDWNDHEHHHIDPYTFPPTLPEFDLHLFGEGRHWHAYRLLGAHVGEQDGIVGTRFSVWAPGAERVSVVGDFNAWDGRVHPMRVRGGTGVWELFLPGIGAGTLYKFEIRHRQSGRVQLKIDPYAQQFQLRPDTASVVAAPTTYPWQDSAWMAQRKTWDWQHAAVSIYEVHLGSWRRDEHGWFLNYRELAPPLVAHVQATGFTHIELLPITEHPLDDSWGYQTTGYFAPTSRHGTPDDFRYFVDYCHQHGIGVILDWVPAHFPRDAHALAAFDGSALYEHEDPRRGEHRDWGTLIYNYGRSEVRNFLLASALYWLEEFHLDGLRVDAVASMLYLDYSREDGDWLPNIHGGNENLEAIAFLRDLNEVCHGQHPGAMVIAEESTAWPQVTRPTWVGGLGFSMKWNMGWMHDTLNYLRHPPIYRQYHHDRLTFGLLYSFTENFLLPLSHDEVVHGKGSLINKMPGDDWQQFANLRLLLAYQFAYPGAKLLFMGAEFAQRAEWAHQRELDWKLLQQAAHQGVQTLVGDLNRLYRGRSSLHGRGFAPDGFEWIDCHDSPQSVISFLRRSGDEFTLVILNFTPVPRPGYRIGVPTAGQYRELLNTDSSYYGGSNLGNPLTLTACPQSYMGRPASLTLTLPPLGGLILALDRDIAG